MQTRAVIPGQDSPLTNVECMQTRLPGAPLLMSYASARLAHPKQAFLILC